MCKASVRVAYAVSVLGVLACASAAGENAVRVRKHDAGIVVSWTVDGEKYYVLEESDDLNVWSGMNYFAESKPEADSMDVIKEIDSGWFFRIRERSARELLNGRWTGTYEIAVVGNCLIRDSKRIVSKVEYDFEIEEDGSAHLIRLSAEDSLAVFRLSGSLSHDGELEMVRRTVDSTCGGVSIGSREYRYTGEYEFRGEEGILEFRAEEEWCPSFNCVFNVALQLNRKFD